MSQPLWSDERIEEVLKQFIHTTFNERTLARQGMKEVRNDYEEHMAAKPPVQEVVPAQPLWSDERIKKEARWFIDASYNKRVVAEQAMVKVRDDYEKYIAEKLSAIQPPAEEGPKFFKDEDLRELHVKLSDPLIVAQITRDYYEVLLRDTKAAIEQAIKANIKARNRD